jgi:hypothetical protein
MAEPISAGTAILASALISAAAQGGSAWYAGNKAKKAGKMRAKETKRATYADLLNSALQNQAELEGLRMDSSQKLGKASTRNLMDTAATMREAFRI